jgi:hypothetical protein
MLVTRQIRPACKRETIMLCKGTSKGTNGWFIIPDMLRWDKAGFVEAADVEQGSNAADCAYDDSMNDVAAGVGEKRRPSMEIEASAAAPVPER